MKSKLTLRLEEDLIKRAKQKAKQKGTSVSQMVADYFALIDSESQNTEQKLPSSTTSLSGILKNSSINEDDYKSYLDKKHLE